MLEIGVSKKNKNERIGGAMASPVVGQYTLNDMVYFTLSSVSATGAQKLSGEGKDLKRILTNDTQFAQLGNNDGQAHFENVELCRVKHSIKLKFKPMK